MRIDWKFVPSEKVCRQPEPVHVVKDALDVWSREEVVPDDLLFLGSETDSVERQNEVPDAC